MPGATRTERADMWADDERDVSVPERRGELEWENAELRRRAWQRTVYLVALAGWIVAFFVYCVWTTPLGLADADAPTFTAVKVLTSVFIGGFVQALLAGWAEESSGDPSRRLVVLALALPLALVIAGVGVQHKHTWYDRGREAFEAYTGKFPRNALGEPTVLAANHSVVTVCAPQVRTTDTYFCVETITDPEYRFDGPSYGDIAGSYRFRSSEQPEGLPSGSTPFNVFDCSGTTLPCDVHESGS